jgi:hypothetical protein
MTRPTPAETSEAPARKIGPLVWILVGIGTLLLCAMLTVGFLAARAVKNAGLAFHFDPARKKLVVIGADGGEVKTSAVGAEEQKVIGAWLTQHPDYRAALDADCACDEALLSNPGAHPYTATGDFNQDGKKDFAAAVIDRKTGKFALLIFDGPIGGIQPALFLKDLDLRRQGLFFDLPFEKPPRLYYGYFNSDDFWRFVPKGNTYTLEYVLPAAPPVTPAATPSNSAADIAGGSTFTSRQVRFSYQDSYSSLRGIDFRDFTFFQNFDEEGKPAGNVSLKNGHYKHDQPLDQFSVDLESTYYLGKTASPNEEFALVLFSWFAAGGSSSQGGNAQVFALSDGHLRVTQEMGWDTHFEAGQPTDSFDESTNTLLVRTAHYMLGDAHCCVSAMDVVRLKWDGRRFVQTNLTTELSEYGKKEGKRLP